MGVGVALLCPDGIVLLKRQGSHGSVQPVKYPHPHRSSSRGWRAKSVDLIGKKVINVYQVVVELDTRAGNKLSTKI